LKNVRHIGEYNFTTGLKRVDREGVSWINLALDKDIGLVIVST